MGGKKPREARLADVSVRAKAPGVHSDGGGLGLMLVVDPNGTRRWVQRVMIRGRRRELGLGGYPVVTLAAARKAALANKRAIQEGRDPLAEKRAARAVLTFAEAVDRYLAAKMDQFGNDKHRKQWRATLDTYARPGLGDRPVGEITAQDVLRVLEPIWQGKTETAKRLRGRIEAVLSWATVAGHRSGDNPARWKGNLSELLPKPGSVARSAHHPAVAQADLPRWWADLCAQGGMAAQALQFATLTAARSGEVREMTRAELDLDNPATGPVWTIPAGRMKNGRPHRVPLTPAAVALLRGLPVLEGSDFVFFAPRGGALSDMALSAVMRRMQAAQVAAGGPGYLDPESKRPAVPHGLRSCFRQWAAERGYARDMAEIALAHFIGSEVERAYQRSDMLARRRNMMTAWADFLNRGHPGTNQ